MLVLWLRERGRSLPPASADVGSRKEEIELFTIGELNAEEHQEECSELRGDIIEGWSVMG